MEKSNTMKGFIAVIITVVLLFAVANFAYGDESKKEVTLSVLYLREKIKSLRLEYIYELPIYINKLQKAQDRLEVILEKEKKEAKTEIEKEKEETKTEAE